MLHVYQPAKGGGKTKNTAELHFFVVSCPTWYTIVWYVPSKA